MNEKSQTARRYDREFKENAVALVREERERPRSHTTLQLANMGRAQREPASLAAETPEQRELRRLQQENDYLRQQRDILKKALGILSAEVPPHATR